MTKQRIRLFLLWLMVVLCAALHGTISMKMLSSNYHIPLELQNNGEVTTTPSCLQARKNIVPKSMYGSSYLHPPAINLGLPKMGSTSLQSFFGCAGYGATHWMCQRGNIEVHCAQCIRNSILANLPPLYKCGQWADMYAEINGPIPNESSSGGGGKLFFPQIEYLEHIVNAYPNATFFLTFRSMDKWYNSLINFWSGLGPRSQKRNMKDEMIAAANITTFRGGGGGDIHDFSVFFCNHVNRVRQVVPPHRLVEIDIEDPSTGAIMAEIFDIDEKCWGNANVNFNLHPENRQDDQSNNNNRVPHLIWGKDWIRGKNGTMRKRPLYNY